SPAYMMSVYGAPAATESAATRRQATAPAGRWRRSTGRLTRPATVKRRAERSQSDSVRCMLQRDRTNLLAQMCLASTEAQIGITVRTAHVCNLVCGVRG